MKQLLLLVTLTLCAQQTHAASSAKTPYAVLGVSRAATDKEIRTAFRNLARKFHPDKFKDKTIQEQKEAEAKFREINEAFQAIGKSYRPSEQPAAQVAAPARRAIPFDIDQYEEFVFLFERVENQLEKFEKLCEKTLPKTRKTLEELLRTTEEQGTYKKGAKLVLEIGMKLNLLENFIVRLALTQEVLAKLQRQDDLQTLNELKAAALQEETIRENSDSLIDLVRFYIPNKFSKKEVTDFEQEVLQFLQTTPFKDAAQELYKAAIDFPASLDILKTHFNKLKARAEGQKPEPKAQQRPQEDPEVAAFIQKSEVLLKTAPPELASQLEGLIYIVRQRQEVSSFIKDRFDEIKAEIKKTANRPALKALEEFNQQLTTLAQALGR